MNPSLLAAELFGLGAILGADQTAGPQWMLAQPLVAGALGGLLAGQPELGLLVGLWGQLTWNGAAPVGAKPHPDGSAGALAGVFAGATLAPEEGILRASLVGIVTMLAVAWLATWPIVFNRRWNAGWTRRALAAPDDARVMQRAGQAQLLGWGVTATLCGMVVLAGAALGGGLGGALLDIVPRHGGAGGALVAMAWGLGIGAGFPAFLRDGKGDWGWLAAGGAAAVGLKLLRVF